MKKFSFINRDSETLEDLVGYINNSMDEEQHRVGMVKFKDRFTIDELVARLNIIKLATNTVSNQLMDISDVNIREELENQRKIINKLFTALKDLQNDVSGLDRIEREEISRNAKI